MRILSLFLICLPFITFAQFQDDFSDGDFTNNPAWEGETTKFIVNTAGELKLDDEESTSLAQLFIRLDLTNITVWECYFRQEFAPSSSNHGRIYLSADSEDFEGALNGYFLKLGGISGSDDALELYRQTGTDTELLLSGVVGALGAANNQARLRVTRDDSGNWTLETDYTGGTNFQEEGSVFDNTHSMGVIFGIYCAYSSTRSDKFIFDDFSISTAPLEDLTAPQLLRTEVLDAQRLSLSFNEAIEARLAEDLNNYSISPTIEISNATLNGTEVSIELESELQAGTNYTLVINEIADQSGNTTTNTSIAFAYTPSVSIHPGDIIINELFADPSPVIGLPEAEFIELYNRTDKTFNLKDFILADAVKEIDLPDYTLASNSYVVLYDVTLSDFSNYGNVLPLTEFLGLGNSGDQLSLLSPEGDLIDIVNYEDDWYQDSDKDNGGWTLERINPDLICERSGLNWAASTHPSGGTPAQQNSIYAAADDTDFAGILRVTPVGDSRLRVFFDEAIDEASVIDFSNYEIEGADIMDAQLETPLNKSILLTFDAPLMAGQLYKLELLGITDCLGNSVNGNASIEFSLPSLAAANDIVINEILFNPVSDGTDFVELYNRSNKAVDLNGLFLANKIDGKLDNIKRITTSYLLLPNTYVVLSADPDDIRTRYNPEVPTAFVEINLPTLPNDEGTLVLYRLDESTTIEIDELAYLDDWHSPLLDDENGVSLERIHPDAPSHMPSSWQSAAASVGYATPTYQNSQFFEQQRTTNDVFSLPESTFSPDEDGYQDFLLLSYATDKVGYIANVRIFDGQGRFVKQLAANELLATTGTFKWDGSTEEGTKARLGIYVLSVEYFTANGNRASYQTTCVLAGEFD